MIKISINESEPIEYLSYKLVSTIGKDEVGNRRLVDTLLPIYSGDISGLKTTEVDYLILASDLQGNVFENDEPILLGEVLPDYLQLIFETKFPDINLQRVGVILCGDLYARLDKRGGLGDVKQVWRNFNQNFSFVAGVSGNHDYYGSPEEFEAFKSEKEIHYLDKQIKNIKGISMGGLSGIIGKPTKHFRNEEASHLKELKKLLAKNPDLILLHEGPSSSVPPNVGNPKIRELIEKAKPSVICFGHNQWKDILVERADGGLLVNLDGRCILLRVD